MDTKNPRNLAGSGGMADSYLGADNMRDFTVRCLGRLILALIPGPNPHATLWRCAERLFPATGQHRASRQPVPSEMSAQPARRPYPDHKSPYAEASASAHTFEDNINPVRPYVTAPRPSRTTLKCAKQAHRRWEIEMHERGHDVGPTRIHGVQLVPGSRTIRVAVAC